MKPGMASLHKKNSNFHCKDIWEGTLHFGKYILQFKDVGVFTTELCIDPSYGSFSHSLLLHHLGDGSFSLQHTWFKYAKNVTLKEGSAKDPSNFQADSDQIQIFLFGSGFIKSILNLIIC